MKAFRQSSISVKLVMKGFEDFENYKEYQAKGSIVGCLRNVIVQLSI